jgi:hypothetical protein
MRHDKSAEGMVVKCICLFFCKKCIDGVINVVIVKPFCIAQNPFF